MWERKELAEEETLHRGMVVRGRGRVKEKRKWLRKKVKLWARKKVSTQKVSKDDFDMGKLRRN